jgi:hypothetical protein
VTLDDLKTAATAAAKTYRARLATVASDQRLSAQGRAEAQAEALALYQAEVKKLQGLAQARIERARAALPEKRATATLLRSAELGSILSEQTRFALLMRRIERMTGPELVQAAGSTGDKWEQAILLEAGRTQFASDPYVTGRIDAIEKTTRWGAAVVQVEAEARQLEADAAVVPMLDVLQARQDLAGRVGVRAENLPADYPFGAPSAA